MITILLLTILVVISAVSADIYMHNPRGSNDRNCEKNTNRNNANRLFDSQNNDKGGYACPRAGTPASAATTKEMYYYENSKLTIEWTNQHACGTYNDCQLILQLMCSDYYIDENGIPQSNVEITDPKFDLSNYLMRDGLPQDANDAATDRMNAGQEAYTYLQYGYHETSSYYDFCSTKTRNTGVWVADQNVQINGPSIFTRQNANGNRFGWECPEERDYYPYWGPSPWMDIAIITSDTSRCKYYKAESQNVKSRYWCKSQATSTTAGATYLSFNSYAKCVSGGGLWIEIPSWGIAAPDCVQAPWSRINHLGNTYESHMSNYNWSLPTYLRSTQPCVLRLRYNISNYETQWTFDARQNGASSPVQTDPYAPYAGLNLSLNVNTNQYGRTFQDRSYRFIIKKRPGDLNVQHNLYNINVRGKRGNIVQTFPAMEYDFTPTQLHITQHEYVHFQWTGSDYNPANNPNNGEGASASSDRSNIMMARSHYLIPTTDDLPWFGGAITDEMMMSLAYINQNLAGCQPYAVLLDSNDDDPTQVDVSSFNCMKLNMAGSPYFDMGYVKFMKVGHYQYMSTRNNNFSNRDQKAALYVHPLYTPGQIAGIVIGSFSIAGLVGFGGAYTYARHHPNGRVAQHINSFTSRLPFIGSK